jgi:hypothetical protein
VDTKTIATPGSVQRHPDESSVRAAVALQEVINRNRIAQLAYTLWEQRGYPSGSAEADWVEAEQRLRSDRPSLQSAST